MQRPTNQNGREFGGQHGVAPRWLEEPPGAGRAVLRAPPAHGARERRGGDTVPCPVTWRGAFGLRALQRRFSLGPTQSSRPQAMTGITAAFGFALTGTVHSGRSTVNTEVSFLKSCLRRAGGLLDPALRKPGQSEQRRHWRTSADGFGETVTIEQQCPTTQLERNSV